MLAAPAVMADHHERTLARQLGLPVRQLAERDRQRSVDTAEIELPWLAHVDDQRRLARGIAAPVREFGGGELRDQNSKRAGVAAFFSGSSTVSNMDRVVTAPGATQRTSCAVITGALADDGEHASSRIQLPDEVIGQHRRRAGEHDRVVGRRPPAARSVADGELDRSDAGVREAGFRFRRQPRVDLDTHDLRALARKERGEVTAAGADLEHALARPELELLDDARLHLGHPHPLAIAERNFEIGEGQQTVGGRHEVLAPDREEQVEDVLVEHLPRADLLLDHVEARLLDVHGNGQFAVRAGPAPGVDDVIGDRTPAPARRPFEDRATDR